MTNFLQRRLKTTYRMWNRPRSLSMCSFKIKSFRIHSLALFDFHTKQLSAGSVGVVLSFCGGAPPGWSGEDSAGSLESSQLRPHGLAWLEPSWCDTTTMMSQAWVCFCGEWVFVSVLCMCVCVHALIRVLLCSWTTCTLVCACACDCSRLLPPTGWSFTFCTGRRDRRLPGCARSLGTVQLAMPGIH